MIRCAHTTSSNTKKKRKFLTFSKNIFISTIGDVVFLYWFHLLKFFIVLCACIVYKNSAWLWCVAPTNEWVVVGVRVQGKKIDVYTCCHRIQPIQYIPSAFKLHPSWTTINSLFFPFFFFSSNVLFILYLMLSLAYISKNLQNFHVWPNTHMARFFTQDIFEGQKPNQISRRWNFVQPKRKYDLIKTKILINSFNEMHDVILFILTCETNCTLYANFKINDFLIEFIQ